MMDISDGLSLDLSRLVEASGVAAILDASQIPVHPDVSSELSIDQRLAAALGDGEDFVLLFTADMQNMDNLVRHGLRLPFPVHCIGTVASGTGCRIRAADGQLTPLLSTGWQHSIS
jgi:thiamine-monophosphate kinase